MKISAEKARKIYRNMMTYWVLYGILGAAIYTLALWLFKGDALIIKDITIAVIIGFLQGGVLVRWLASYHLGELERKEKEE